MASRRVTEETMSPLPMDGLNEAKQHLGLIFSLEAADNALIARLQAACGIRWQKYNSNEFQILDHEVSRAVVYKRQHLSFLFLKLLIKLLHPLYEDL